LIVGLKGAGNDYLKGKFDSTENTQLGSLLIPELPLKGCSLHSLTSNNICSIYTPKGMEIEDCIFVCCSYVVPEERAFEWTRTLFSIINAETVIILDQVPSRKYHKDLPSPVILKCETVAFKVLNQLENIRPVDAPFLIDGGAAAIISYCQINSIPAANIISFIELNNEASLDEIKVFDQISNLLPTPLHDLNIPERKSALYKYNERFIDFL